MANEGYICGFSVHFHFVVLWKCGSPAEPTFFAHFAREDELEFFFF